MRNLKTIWWIVLFLIMAGQAYGNSKNYHLPERDILKDNRIVLAVNQQGCGVCVRTIDLLYTEAFGRIGYEFAYAFHPLKRSLLESDSGRIDGDRAAIGASRQRGREEGPGGRRSTRGDCCRQAGPTFEWGGLQHS